MRTLLTFGLSALVAIASSTGANETVDQGRELATSGLAFLQQQQQPDGTWQADERVPPAVTALVLRAFVGNDAYTPDSPLVRRGFDALVAQQVEDGGIYDDLLANYNTAISTTALAEARREAGDDRYTDTIDAAVAYLRRLQWTPETQADFEGEELSQSVSSEDDPFFGGWGYGGRSRGAGRPDLSNAAMALEALHEAGVPLDDPAFERARMFVSRLQNRSESNDQPWAGNDGGFVYSPDEDRSGESFAGETTTPDGDRRLRSYGSMTYAGLKSMIYAGLDADDPRVLAAVAWAGDNWTLDANPGMRLAGENQAEWGLFYYYLMVARSLDAYDQPVLDTIDGPVDWRLALIDALAQRQNADGSWSGNPKWRENDPTMVTAYSVIALNAALKDLAENPPE
ncbi:MAG: prenyltransferase/squalene oxidase repeat-containing protein [Planctomycetota bacterium]